MFLTHADETHTSFFPKVFPLEKAETEDYPDLSELQAIYHTCPFDHYVFTGPPQHTEVQDWLEANKDKTIMINDGIECGTAKCLEEHDYATCTCLNDNRKILLCPQNPEIKMEFLAANLNKCERNRFGQIDSDKDSLVARITYNDFSMLLAGDNKSPVQEDFVAFYQSQDEDYLKSTVIKLASHGSSYGTTNALVAAVEPEIAFYSSAHLNQDWSSGDCETMKRIINHKNSNGDRTIRQIPQGQDHLVQEEINCYDPWAPDLPDDQPIRTIENVHRAAYYSTTYGKKIFHRDPHNTEGKWTWPCNINRLDITSDGTKEGSMLTPKPQGEMPYPPCMRPDYWN